MPLGLMPMPPMLPLPPPEEAAPPTFFLGFSTMTACTQGPGFRFHSSPEPSS